MRRREFLGVLGGAALALPVAARARQPMLTIGLLSSQTHDAVADYMLRGFRSGLKDTGYVEGDNLAVDYRWGENQSERLPALTAELVRRQVAVIVTYGGPASEAAVNVKTTVPIVFMAAEDPVRLGLVTSLARPGGNLTGVKFFAAELAGKRLELLRELVPTATRVAVLLNPAEVAIAAANLRDVEAAARAMRLQIQVLNASTSLEIDAAFVTIAHEPPDALFISSGPFFTSRRVQLAHLATRHGIPAIQGSRLYPEVGGLISYGANVMDASRQAGTYVGRILKGAKPADMPVVQSTKFELVINNQTAKTLRMIVPQSLLVAADEVIE